MGVTWIADIVSWVVGGPSEVWYFTDLINCLQGVFIFIVVGCQPQVIKTRFNYKNSVSNESNLLYTCLAQRHHFACFILSLVSFRCSARLRGCGASTKTEESKLPAQRIIIHQAPMGYRRWEIVHSITRLLQPTAKRSLWNQPIVN